MIIVDEIEAFIDSLDLSSIITAFVSGASSVITVENTFHVRAGLIISIDGTPFTVSSVNYSTNEITVSGTPATAEEMVAPKPFYWHGTPYETNNHISRLKDEEKLPMIYLLEILRETLQPEESALESIARLRLFFLDVANYQDWNTDQHYSNVIVPQRRLLDAFIDQARNSKVFGDIETVEIIPHVKFGIYQPNKGHTNSLFNERLSGIEAAAEFPFKRKCC